MESALITIIVPVYNVAVYLDRCVESIIHQTYHNLEIILVDDGSTDGSADLCDLWAERDERIRVIHQENGGLSMARNAALDIMTGDYVAMVDGDDYVGIDFARILYKVISHNRADIAAAAWSIFDDGNDPQITLDDGPELTFTSSEAIDDVFYQHTLTNSACSKLFKSSIFKTLRFPQGLLYEDLAVIYDILEGAQTVAYTSRTLYYYRQRSGSITQKFTPERIHVLDITEQIEKRMATAAPEHLPAARSRRLSACFNILLLCPTDGSMDDVVARCWLGIKTLRKGCLLDPHVRLKNKLGILLSYFGLKALRLFHR
ncbi:MAG: glycosyltransferase [Muribaculaceae bacterium]|nr:glycosyltransferase [Muribaculaceae bacterium]